MCWFKTKNVKNYKDIMTQSTRTAVMSITVTRELSICLVVLLVAAWLFCHLISSPMGDKLKENTAASWWVRQQRLLYCTISRANRSARNCTLNSSNTDVLLEPKVLIPDSSWSLPRWELDHAARCLDFYDQSALSSPTHQLSAYYVSVLHGDAIAFWWFAL